MFVCCMLCDKNMSDLSNAIKQICEEKSLSYEAVLATIESALSAAYRKDFGKKNQNIHVEFDPETGKSKVFDIKTVVEDLPEEEEVEELKGTPAEVEEKKEFKKVKSVKSGKDIMEKEKKSKAEAKDEKEPADNKEEPEEEERKFNPKTEIQISEAKFIKKTSKIGDELKIKLEIPDAYGRMAAQTAKQVIIQRLREAEREMIFNDFKEKENEVVSGVVQRREGKIVLIDLGKTVGILPYEEMIPGEVYKPGDRIKIFVKEVGLKSKGPEIVLSRTSEEILKKVFYLEIPEISNGLIEIKVVAREAGFRSKVAVWTDSDNVDPIGSCVGQRGARIQTVISELGGEKVDIIMYDEDPVKFITNALSPAKITGIDINEKEKKATVKVQEDQLSLAIGKGGQNARLAAKLTGWKIDIIEDKAKQAVESVKTESEADKNQDEKKEKTEKKAIKKTRKQKSKKANDKESKDVKKVEKQESKKARKQESKKASGKESEEVKKVEKKEKTDKKESKKTRKQESKKASGKESEEVKKVEKKEKKEKQDSAKEDKK